MIRVRNLSKRYGKRSIINDITFDVTDGDVVAIMGTSEREKRVLIRCLNLMEKPTSGEITLNGEDVSAKETNIPDLRKRVGMVFPETALLNDRTVVENVMTAPVHLQKKKKSKAYEESMELLSEVGIKEKARFFPDEIDVGVKKRAAIARALAMKPEVLLLENPTQNLDSSMVYEVTHVLEKVANKGQTIVFVTSDVELARKIATKVIFLHKGKICEQGVARDVLDNPTTEVVHTYLQRMRQMLFKIISHEFDFMRLSGELGKYCKENIIENDKRQRMQFVAYQLLTECIVPFVKRKRLDLTFAVSFFDRQGRIEMTVEYEGPENNPLANEKTHFAVEKINECSSQFKYLYGNRKNIITVIL